MKKIDERDRVNTQRVYDIAGDIVKSWRENGPSTEKVGLALAGVMIADLLYPRAVEGLSKPRKMIGSDGVQVTSKTLWKEKGSSARIDIENPNPGKRPGQIHYQDEDGAKYLFSQVKKVFVDKDGNVAPKSVNDNLKNPDFVRKLNEGLVKYLGEKGIE
ncbi:hypothetical protein [Sporomusa sp.]|uniref:hypothetical protein n=1 Tax=Sporomusa sp. TaxID=2078658 RepID=UPI002C6C759F|nr:hypothetical protein [Sporomusa sp.]HWR06298.1 hypothetical protein [Sporomusa sp.]